MPEYVPKIPEPSEEQIRTALVNLIAHYHNPVRVYAPAAYSGAAKILDVPVHCTCTKTTFIECSTGRFDLSGNPA